MTPAPQAATLGLGLAALGRPSYINLGRDVDLPADRSVAAMEARCHAMLDAAYAAGVRYFDAARSYGLAERFLGVWLNARDLAPGQVTIGSKWGYTYTADWKPDAAIHEVKDLSAANLARQFQESRSLLGPRLSLYQIHSATLESGVLDDAAVLAELVRLSESGVAIGLTVSGPRQADTIRRAFGASVDGVNPFRCVQATWNLLEPSAGPALADAHALGWTVIVKESLANGRLARIDQRAIAAAMAQPWADVVLSGAVTEAQLASNLGAVGLALTEAEMLDLLAGAEPPETYWRTRSQLAWR